MTHRIETAEASTDELLGKYYTPKDCLDSCKKCKCFGTQWSCPPLSVDTTALLKPYKRARIYIAIIETTTRIPISDEASVTRPARIMLENLLREEEGKTGGRASYTIGRCLYCDEPCARISNQPCRHPNDIRPSLEAMGFNVIGILRDIAGIELQWSTDGNLPATLCLVGAIFY